MRERALLLRWKQDENISAIFDLGDSRFWVWAGFWKSWAPPEHCWHDASPYMLLYGPNWAKFGPSLGQIGPKQPIFKVETRDFGSLYVFENTHHYQCIHKIIWAYTSENLGQVDQNWVNCWAKFEPNWAQKSPIGPNWIGVPILIIETCIVLIIMTTLRAYLKWPCEYIISFELTPVKIWVKWTKIGSNVWPKWFNYGWQDNRLLTSFR